MKSESNVHSEISYRNDILPKINEIIEVFLSSGIQRPVHNKDRIKKMFLNSNLIIAVWDQNQLVGLARGFTDFCYCCYLSDLAVKKEYQNRGIGKKLIEIVKKMIGKETSLILLSAPDAIHYYPKLGFEKIDNGFIIKRSE